MNNKTNELDAYIKIGIGILFVALIFYWGSAAALMLYFNEPISFSEFIISAAFINGLLISGIIGLHHKSRGLSVLGAIPLLLDIYALVDKGMMIAVIILSVGVFYLKVIDAVFKYNSHLKANN
ncbi:hypothetical protein HOH87_05405 [bacterium]|mgnify:CR=1 FL=1|jgi:hypothetical protein|nr:hypothetical protein [bacterium]